MRQILLLTALLMLTIYVSAQDRSFEVGLEGGPSLTYLSGNEAIKESLRPTVGFSGGLTFQYNFPKIVSLRTNLSFERKGAQGELQVNPIQEGDPNLGPTPTEIKIRENFDYLTIPILVRVSFGNKVKFLANVGPYFGFLMKQTYQDNLTFGSIDGDTFVTLDNTDNYKRFDVGLTGGIGVSLTLKDKFILSLEGRHNLGLYNTSKLPVFNDGTIKTNATNLLVGFAYKFGGK